jgi:hypothetical protein
MQTILYINFIYIKLYSALSDTKLIVFKERERERERKRGEGERERERVNKEMIYK